MSACDAVAAGKHPANEACASRVSQGSLYPLEARHGAACRPVRQHPAHVQCRFDIPAFYGEAARVLRLGGTLAVWGYGLNTFDGEPAATEALRVLHDDVLGPYWDAKRQLLIEHYKGANVGPCMEAGACCILNHSISRLCHHIAMSVPRHSHRGKLHLCICVRSRIQMLCYLLYPHNVTWDDAGLEPGPPLFCDVERHEYPMPKPMTVEQYRGYLRSWSSYQTWREAHSSTDPDPLDAFTAELMRTSRAASLTDTLPVLFTVFAIFARKST